MTLFLTALALYIGVGLMLYFAQRSMIYFPTPVADSAGEDRFVTQGDLRIHLNAINPGQERAVLYFGGNAEAVSQNAPSFRTLFSDRTVYLFHYRGYGKSTGTPSEQAILADAEKVFDELSRQHKSILLMGRSLGTGVAVHLASLYPVAAMILITPYDSILRVAQKRFPVYPLNLLLKDTYRSDKKIHNTQAAKLILAASEDTVVPLPHAKALAERIPKKRLTFVVIDGAGHNDISGFPLYEKSIEAFVTRINATARSDD